MSNRFLLILTFLFSNLTNTNALHIVGGDLAYKCLGGDYYEITMIIYRDCGSEQGADFDRPGNIAIYNDTLYANLEVAVSDIKNLSADIYDPCFSVPTDICVEQGIYKTTLYLPPNRDGYTVSYQRCCRNSSLKNIQNPDKVGTTITTKIPGALAIGCNSSPVFKEPPPLAICLGSNFRFDHSAIDADGDSLAYSFCSPFLGGSDAVRIPGPSNSVSPIPATKPPYQSVPWSAGYSKNNPFNITVPFALDAITGYIMGTPITRGTFLYGVCVKEYRNGIEIGETRREFQVNVVTCESNTKALFDPPEDCSGLTLNFINQSVTSLDFFWDFDLKNAGKIVSTLKSPTITFPDSGKYNVRLIANPSYECADTIEHTLNVFSELIPKIKGDLFSCVSDPKFELIADGNFKSYTKFLWNFPTGASILTDTAKKTGPFTYSKTGSFDVELTMSHSICKASTKVALEVIENPQLKVSSKNTSGCSPLFVEFENQSESVSNLTTIWSFNDEHKNRLQSKNKLERWKFSKPDTYNISLLTYTTDKCIDTLGPINYSIKVYESPKASFDLSDSVLSIFNPEIEIFNKSINAKICQLFLGKSIAESRCGGKFMFDKPGIYRVSQFVEGRDGCIDTLSKKVVVKNDFQFFAPNSFTPNSNGINEEFRPILYGTKEYQLNIFDRWGHVVFSTNNPKEGWSGIDIKTQGPAPIGVYIYRVKLLDFVDEYHFYVGEVNLFR